MAFWNFPAVTGGNINSINNAGLETFRDNALDSLTREICQNSLDAIKDKEKPVIVEFHKYKTNAMDFPGKDRLIEVFQSCRDTWHNRNPKSEEFIENALHILEKSHIDFLRISDFNTIGLKGAKNAELGSPWSSLVKEAGSSNKGDESGGSFGIGKAAPFLNSNLRTLFYSSFDIDDYKSHIGVANIMSYKTIDNKITLGNGYFTNDYNSGAIEGLINLDPSFTRNETGTDIFVSAFEPVVNWQQEIIQSVLYNFFITIYQKKLIVKVDGYEITHSNIEELINKLEDNEENRILKSYFKVLVSKETIKVPYPAQKYKHGIQFKEGEATLYLINGDDLNRRILMTRKTGMRIFEQKNISGSISFTGILMITGSQMNSIFKQMENPAHSGWMPNRFEKNPNLAKKIYADLRGFIREEVKKAFQQTTSDVMDAVGLSDFLPDKSLLEDKGDKQVESIVTNIKDIALKKKEQPKKKKPKKKGRKEQNLEEQLAGEFGITSGDEGGNGLGEGGSGGNDGGGASETGGQNEIDKNTEGKLDKETKKQERTIPVVSKSKYICANKESGKYNFRISTDKYIKNGQLNFSLIGEQSDYDLPIVNAQFQDESIVVEKVSSNAIYFHSEEAKKTFNISVEVDYSDYCVMEVDVFENK